MLPLVFLTSLKITGIYIAFQEGNVLSWLRVRVANFLDRNIGKKGSRFVQKPVFDCLPCMASVWTILLTWSIDVGLILAVAGLNAVICVVLCDDEEVKEYPTIGPYEA